MLRISGLFTVVLCFCVLGMAVAEDKKAAKIDGSKLVGTWLFVKDAKLPPGTPPGTVEFTKDGKLFLKIAPDGKEIKQEGTYKVEGDKVTLTKKSPDGKDYVEIDVIKTLSEDRLILTDPMGKETEFKKKSGK